MYAYYTSPSIPIYGTGNVYVPRNPVALGYGERRR